MRYVLVKSTIELRAGVDHDDGGGSGGWKRLECKVESEIKGKARE
jgi:hypothetical protein